MSRKKEPGAFSSHDVAMLETLFGEREHVIETIRAAHDPAPENHRIDLAAMLDTRLVDYIRDFNNKLFNSLFSGEQRRQRELQNKPALKLSVTSFSPNCTALDSGREFIEAVETAAKLLRAAKDQAETAEVAEWLDRVWLKFVADASAYRMYDDMVKTIATRKAGSETANANREKSVDDALIKDFSDWQAKSGTALRSNDQPLSAKERVKKFKIAKRPLGDRKTRRLNKLLREEKIPPLK